VNPDLKLLYEPQPPYPVCRALPSETVISKFRQNVFSTRHSRFEKAWCAVHHGITSDANGAHNSNCATVGTDTASVDNVRRHSCFPPVPHHHEHNG